MALSAGIWRWLLNDNRAGLSDGTRRVGTRPSQQHDLWNGSGNDQYRIRSAANPALHLRTARRSACRHRNRVRGGGDVSRDCYSPGKWGTRHAPGKGRSDNAGEADRAQSDGAIDSDRFDVDDHRSADAGPTCGLYEHLRGCADAVRALRDWAKPVG